MEKDQLIRYILNMEWDMFTNVQNQNGRADCQDDYETFVIMRLSQLYIWDQDILASYFLDLMEAKEAGRNLMTEKYGYMMEQTDPEGYARIKDLLPEVSQEKRSMAQAIVRIYKVWEREMAVRYPKLRSRGRAGKTEPTLDGSVSVEDYQYCELITYSERTLKLLLEYIGEHAGENLYIAEVANMVQAYGYENLEAAEAVL